MKVGDWPRRLRKSRERKVEPGNRKLFAQSFAVRRFGAGLQKGLPSANRNVSNDEVGTVKRMGAMSE
jgi:hypothetical protein